MPAPLLVAALLALMIPTAGAETIHIFGTTLVVGGTRPQPATTTTQTPPEPTESISPDPLDDGLLLEAPPRMDASTIPLPPPMVADENLEDIGAIWERIDAHLSQAERGIESSFTRANASQLSAMPSYAAKSSPTEQSVPVAVVFSRNDEMEVQSGGLASKSILATMDGLSPRFRACVPDRQPSAGRLHLVIGVADDGSVADLQVTANTGLRPDVAECLAKEVREARFERPEAAFEFEYDLKMGF